MRNSSLTSSTRLSSAVDAETGAPLLEDTVVFWAQELGDGRMHTCEAVPWVLAGSGGGFFSTGRKVDLTGVTHDAVLVSIAQAFGLPYDLHWRRQRRSSGGAPMSRWILFTLAALACGGDKDESSSPEGVGAGGADDTAGSADDTGAETLCPEDVDLEERVWDPVFSTYCVGCHVSDGPAAGTRMVFKPGDMLHNLRAASGVVDLLLLKPTGLHEAGMPAVRLFFQRLKPGKHSNSGSTGPTASVKKERKGARMDPYRGDCVALDHSEYQRTIEDLLGIATDHADTLAPDVAIDGFPNDVDALLVSGLLADQYRAAAEDMASVADISGMLSLCPRGGGAVTQCAAQTINDLGTRTFRRPLAADELTVYLELWADVAAEDGFFEGIRWVLAGMLQSPHFLYRSEAGHLQGGESYVLTDWEVASALSYLIWGTMPDDELFAAAASGEPEHLGEIEVQADRLLADDRALETAADFVEIWLHLDRLATVSREGLTWELQEAMREQTRETVKTLVSEGAPLSALVAGTQSHIPDTLAAHYGLSESGWVSLDGERYGGLLTHGSLLTVFALADGSSPVHRGVAVRERMLCEHLPPPPANLDTSPPATDADGTTREKYAVHSSLPECASCHDMIDPIGFGFENYDHLGRFRTEEVGQPVDASGDVDGRSFDGVADLAELLVEEDRFRACFVETWRRWGQGTESCADDAGDVGIIDPLRELTTRASFTQRVAAADEGATRAQGGRPVIRRDPECGRCGG